MKKLLRMLAVAAGLAGAGAAQAQLACNISSASPMLFGTYNPLLFTDHLAQTSMNIRCTGADYRLMLIRLGPGLYGTVAARNMRSAAGFTMSYFLYSNSARSIIWGDGTGGTYPNFLIVGPGSNSTLQMYGRIPQRQNVRVGAYTDIVTVAIDF